MTITIEPIGSVRPSTYNPRMADEERLSMVALSLRKLGFVLPIVADAAGEIVSGHQRHLCAERLGFEQVPVLRVAMADEATRRALNIVFNRGTNDMSTTDHSPGMTARLAQSRVLELAAALPDAANPFRCAAARPVALAPIADRVRPLYDPHMRNMARALHYRGDVQMPLVLTEGGRLINGLGRVQYGMEAGFKDWPAVTISEQEGDFAEAMLNLLSMDFDIHTRYEDLLRHNSFRRVSSTRSHLGTGFTFALPKRPATTEDFDVREPASAATWKRTYGLSVVDFGAGHLHETELLRGIGVSVTPFEPYRLVENEVSKEESVALTREFLARIAERRQFSSIFVSSVLNSVPFLADRKCIMQICAALAGPRTTFYVNAMSTEHGNLRAATGSQEFSKCRQETGTFMLSYEPGILLGDFMAKPKVQKYHTGEELYSLIKTAWSTVNVERTPGNLFAKARGPIINPTALRNALAFEFNLPYPDGSRMGLVDEAIDAFSRRLGIAL